MIVEHFISGQRRFHKEKSLSEQPIKEDKGKDILHRDRYTIKNLLHNLISFIKNIIFDHKFINLIIFVLVLIVVIKSLK